MEEGREEEGEEKMNSVVEGPALLESTKMMGPQILSSLEDPLMC